MAEHEPGKAGAPEGSGGLMPRLLDEAERAVAGLEQPHLKAPLLARISALHGDVAPDIAAREAAEATALAEHIDDPYVRSFALAEVSKLAAADAPAAMPAARAALRAAKVVVDMRAKAIVLAEAACALVQSDRVGAERILAEAENLADAACSCRRRCVLAAVLERTAGVDPEDALHKADQIPDPQFRGIVLARALPRLAAADPHRAVALVAEVPELHEQIKAWVSLCEVLAGMDPELAVFAAECAEWDAGFSHNRLVRLHAFSRVSRSIHGVEPARAERLLAVAETELGQEELSHGRSLAAAELARAQAVSDAESGLRTAQEIRHGDVRARALVLLAEDQRTHAGL